MSIKTIVITGPTASGKSDFANKLAAQVNGEIINADSMQLYEHLCIITARPTGSFSAPHHLYGYLKSKEQSDLSWWYKKACSLILQISEKGKTPIVVGGTGMYLKALQDGIATIPNIPDSIRLSARSLQKSVPAEEFYNTVLTEDPNIQGRLEINDQQRLIRALEVIKATGKSIFDWQKNTQRLMDLDIIWCVVSPDRQDLYKRINDRFHTMMDEGAIEEVRQLMKANLPPAHPILKAVGVKELSAHLRGELSIEKAIEKAQQASRNYAKRQYTWQRHQIKPSVEILEFPKAADITRVISAIDEQQTQAG